MSNRRARLGMLGLLLLSVLLLTAALPASTDLLKDAHWEYATHPAKQWQAEPMPVPAPAGEQVTMRVRASFEVKDPAEFLSVSFTHGLPVKQKMYFELNGQIVPLPLPGMLYQTIPGISPSMLKKGVNTLEGYIVFDNGPSTKPADEKPLVMKSELLALTAGDLRVDFGPVLGAFDDKYFSLTCRTNMPATASIVVAADPAASSPATGPALATIAPLEEPAKGLFHRFRVDRTSLPAGATCTLVLQAGPRKIILPVLPPAPADADKLHFVATGDTRTLPRDWAKVAQAVSNANPQLLGFVGDFITDGRQYDLWENEYYKPAQGLLAHVPLYPVWGNHERGSPILQALFFTASPDGKAENWAQQVGPALMIGIEGWQDFSKGSHNATWLEWQLSSSRAKFIFLFSHYPAWSSGEHGAKDIKGDAASQAAVHNAREVIVPLLAKYQAAAMIVGHDHHYERSELPGGVVELIAGGAGAPRYPVLFPAPGQNPYSKVISTQLSYCVFDILGDDCQMKVFTPQGQQLDERAWKARQLPAK